MTNNESSTVGASERSEFQRRTDETIESLRAEIDRRLASSREELLSVVNEFAQRLPQPPEPEIVEVEAPPMAPAAPLPSQATPVGGPAMADLRDSIAELDEADNQAELMARLVEQASTFASRTVLLLDNQQSGLRAWASLGFGRAGTSLEGLELASPVEPAWIAARESSQALTSAQCEPLCGFIDVERPLQGALVPLAVRGRVLAILYADQTSPGDRFSIEALQLLTHAAAQGLDLLQLGDAASSPTLRIAGLEADIEGPSEPPIPADGAVAESDESEPAQALPDSASADERLVQVDEPAEDLSAASFDPSEQPSQAPEPAFDAIEESAIEESAIEESAIEADAIEDDGIVDDAIEDVRAFEDASLDVQPFEPEPPSATEAPTVLEPSPDPSLPSTEAEPLTPAERQAGFVLEELPTGGPTTPPPPPVQPPEAQEVLAPAPEVAAPPPPPPAVAPPEVAPEDSDSEFEPVAEPAPPSSPAGFKLDSGSAAPPPAPMPSFDGSSLATQVITPDQIAAFEADAAAAMSSSTAHERPAPTPPAVAPPPLDSEPLTEASDSVNLTGTSQVMPPADLDGPGLAFRSTPPPGDDPAHDEAKRLARLLVSEIKLYNGEQIRAGKVAGNIYAQMRDDIDRSRQMYEERIDARVRETSNYFRDELVRTLAEGDESVLGL